MIVKDPQGEAAVAEVTSLSDRRKIAALEAKLAALQEQLAARGSEIKPALGVARSPCMHHLAAQVSDTKPEVTGGACGGVLDPYEVLRKIARREVNFCHSMNALLQSQLALTAEVEELKAQRGRLRRSTRAAADVSAATLGAKLRAGGVQAYGVQRSLGGWMAVALVGAARFEASAAEPELAADAVLEQVAAARGAG